MAEAKRKGAHPRSTAILVAYDVSGEVVMEQEMPLDKYYDDLHPLIDESEYRRKRRIVRLHGRLFNMKRELYQEFECRSGQDGEIIDQRAL